MRALRGRWARDLLLDRGFRQGRYPARVEGDSIVVDCGERAVGR